MIHYASLCNYHCNYIYIRIYIYTIYIYIYIIFIHTCIYVRIYIVTVRILQEASILEWFPVDFRFDSGDWEQDTPWLGPNLQVWVHRTAYIRDHLYLGMNNIPQPQRFANKSVLNALEP